MRMFSSKSPISDTYSVRIFFVFVSLHDSRLSYTRKIFHQTGHELKRTNIFLFVSCYLRFGMFPAATCKINVNYHGYNRIRFQRSSTVKSVTYYLHFCFIITTLITHWYIVSSLNLITYIYIYKQQPHVVNLA